MKQWIKWIEQEKKLMETIVVVAHPRLEDSGTQRFLKEAVSDLNYVVWHELRVNSAGHFDKIAEKNNLRDKDRIIFQFPLYWYSAPALLKQWIDEIFDMTDAAWLQKKELGIVVSLGQPLREYRLGGREGIALSELLSPFKAFAKYLGMTLMPLFIVEQFSYQNEKQHQKLMINYQQFLELPRAFDFDQKQRWFENKLKQKLETCSENKGDLEKILEEFTERHDQLSDLKNEINLIRRKDDYYGEP